jgi:hypothetical protein
MRAIFSILSLLLVVAIVGFLAKKQMASVGNIQVPSVTAPAASGDAVAPKIDPAGNAQQQSQQIQNQVKSAVEAAVNQSRPVTEEK